MRWERVMFQISMLLLRLGSGWGWVVTPSIRHDTINRVRTRQRMESVANHRSCRATVTHSSMPSSPSEPELEPEEDEFTGPLVVHGLTASEDGFRALLLEAESGLVLPLRIDDIPDKAESTEALTLCQLFQVLLGLSLCTLHLPG